MSLKLRLFEHGALKGRAVHGFRYLITSVTALHAVSDRHSSARGEPSEGLLSHIAAVTVRVTPGRVETLDTVTTKAEGPVAKSRNLGTENSRHREIGLKGAAQTRGLQFCCINLYAHATAQILCTCHSAICADS